MMSQTPQCMNSQCIEVITGTCTLNISQAVIFLLIAANRKKSVEKLQQKWKFSTHWNHFFSSFCWNLKKKTLLLFVSCLGSRSIACFWPIYVIFMQEVLFSHADHVNYNLQYFFNFTVPPHPITTATAFHEPLNRQCQTLTHHWSKKMATTKF